MYLALSNIFTIVTIDMYFINCNKDTLFIYLFFILGVDRAQNLTKHNRWLRVFIQLTNRNIAITQFMHSV